MPAPPPTAYPAGTKLTVGSHEVEIVQFIGEGGFAHVYTVHTTPEIPGYETACLKRVQVPNKAYLNLLRAEVDAMQRLKGASNVVQYFDSHAERMRDPQVPGQYEVFLLMEFCERGGLIDFMNTRLRERLRENEILKIMYDITQGLSHMHYLQPPLLHRDLKIENVLISGDGTFKLCDFGSVSPVLRPPKTPQEFQILEDDIQHHTTVQYRAPEMVAIARGNPIDEKSDIWALGIFLYKLCYYTTPFERPNQTLEQFQQLILSGVFPIPPRPAYSERLRNMICVLLQPDPRLRPNVFQVMQEICSMRHVECPIKDIYSSRQPQPVAGAPGAAPSGGAPIPAASMVPGQVPGQVPPMQAPVQQPGQPPLGSYPLGAQQQQQRAAAYHPQVLGPAPGQVPVPGVLLTSPMATPASPLSRAISPMDQGDDDDDDTNDITTRFPSLEELDLANSSSLVDFNKSPGSLSKQPSQTQLHTTTSQQPALYASPQTQPAAYIPAPPVGSAGAGAGAPAGTAQPVPPPKPGKERYSYTKSPPDGDYEMPKRPARKPRDDEEPSKSVSAEAAKLKQILTGISGRSSTVIMDTPPENKNLSSMDFLRTLQTSESSSSSHHHHPHHHHHSLKPHKIMGRKPSLHKYFHEKKEDKKGLYDDDDDDDDDEGDDAFIGLARHGGDAAEEEPFDFSDQASISPLASPVHSPSRSVPVSPVAPAKPKPIVTAAKPVVKTGVKPGVKPSLASPKGSASASAPAQTVSQKPKLEYAKPETEKPGHVRHSSQDYSSLSSAAKPSSLLPHAKPVTRIATTPMERARPKSMVLGTHEVAFQTTGSLDAFRPSNSIQQRVHSFLNSHDRQHPPRRTARGYGRFTDIDSDHSDGEATTGTPSDDEEYAHIKESRSKSLGDNLVPPTPSRASKPKVSK